MSKKQTPQKLPNLDEGDPDEMITMPFKFVTGISQLCHHLHSRRGWLNLPAAGFDARFPNQNQYKHTVLRLDQDSI